MLIVDHRRNALTQIEATPVRFGAEIDLRNHGNDILVTHDPFIPDAPRLEEWLEQYKHRFLIANVKEEGMEERLLPLLEQFGVQDFFILDESFPFIRKYARAGVPNFALRVSEFEDYRTALNLVSDLKAVERRVDWVWADSFTGNPLHADVMKALRDAGLKICAVSPELHHVNQPDVWNDLVLGMQDKLSDLNIMPEMVCTKCLTLWEDFSNS